MPNSNLPPLDPALFDAAQSAKAWPFVEARKIVKRLERNGGDVAIFETGYGPSGLPHIGTFGEVARTNMVRNAFRLLTRDQIKTRLICFSDDMDGMRKIPPHLPNQEMLAQYLGQPLSRVPDPFSDQYKSFADHNNHRLMEFLDQFGFEYEFISSTDYYTSGRFDEALLKMLGAYDKVMDIIMPTIGEERRKTYSPFLPVSPKTGVVLQVPMVDRDPVKGTITYIDPESNEPVETKVTGGAVKCQWKADWALRWFALDIDYEMAGKDLIDSVKLSSRIVKALGGRPPEGFNYELFLDETGQKISKSKGNGLPVEQWLTYASPESISLFMYQKPMTAKRLYFDVIPKAVDEYYSFAAAYGRQTNEERLNNPAFHIHGGAPATGEIPLSFALLLNLVSAANAHDEGVLWGFIGRYVEGATPKTHPELDRLVSYAMRYFHDFVKPGKKFRLPDDQERLALEKLRDQLASLAGSTDASAIQNIVYEVGKQAGFDPLRNWFKALYQVLLGQDQGPRFGSFVALYGVEETRELIKKALAGELASG
ncbi:Lysyl-tRNA synthetase (class I) [hydrothermal vent metagenome]|uniref:Lysine--tRNA ligase n=1 Tax=hydrothermal vent metagenome TaxID=652676 RepID=A0A3B0TPQ5_9ZZZZ